MDHCHRDAVRKQSRLNLTPYVPHLDVGVRLMDHVGIADGFGHGAAHDETLDSAINHPIKLEVRCKRLPRIVNACRSS